MWLPTPSKKMLFATDGDQFRTPHWSQLQRKSAHGVPSPSGYVHNTAAAPEKGQEDFRSQRARKSAVSLWLLEMTGKLHR